jgi:hypothetical protein
MVGNTANESGSVGGVVPELQAVRAEDPVDTSTVGWSAGQD